MSESTLLDRGDATVGGEYDVFGVLLEIGGLYLAPGDGGGDDEGVGGGVVGPACAGGGWLFGLLGLREGCGGEGEEREEGEEKL